MKKLSKEDLEKEALIVNDTMKRLNITAEQLEAAGTLYNSLYIDILEGGGKGDLIQYVEKISTTDIPEKLKLWVAVKLGEKLKFD